MIKLVTTTVDPSLRVTVVALGVEVAKTVFVVVLLTVEVTGPSVVMPLSVRVSFTVLVSVTRTGVIVRPVS